MFPYLHWLDLLDIYKLRNKIKGFFSNSSITFLEMATSMIYLFVTILLVAAHTAFAESNMLQDFCVADLKGITSLLSVLLTFIFWKKVDSCHISE